MKIREIVTENIFTCDYHKVMDAVAHLYQTHYDINIWERADAHDEAAKVLMKQHPTDDELDYIIDSAELPERFLDLDFPLNDEIMYGVSTDQDSKVSEAVDGVEGAEQRMLDRMGKRFGLPPGSTADQVQAAQQAHLDKNDPAAAAQYKKKMDTIDAGGSAADTAPVKLAPKAATPAAPGAAAPETGAEFKARAATAKSQNQSPIAIMLAQPAIGKNQAMLDVIAPTVGLPVGSTAADILAADDARNAKAGNKYAKPAAAPAAESMGGATDSKGRTQREWMRLVKAKYPDAKIQQSKMIDGPVRAVLANGRTLGWNKAETMVDEEPASRALCTSGKPDSALGASQLASCKSQGYRSRDGGKSHKVGSERIAMRGKKIKGKKYGGPLPDWS